MIDPVELLRDLIRFDTTNPPGNEEACVAFVEGVSSPYSLMAASKGVYGESAGEWTPVDALGFSKMLALPGIFYTRAGKGPAA